MKYIILLLALFIGSIAIYFSPQKKIVNNQDFEFYLNKTHLSLAKKNGQKEINFWNKKLEISPNNFVYQKKLAGLLAKDFKLSGNIENLLKSKAILQSIHERFPNQVGVLHSLTANAITQHAFLEAEKYTKAALEIGEKRYVSSLLFADVALERGHFREAKNMLGILANKNQFDFLIRNMKIHDQEGNLKLAIKDMEKAAEIAKSSGNKTLSNWSLSNLGDMYGHDGRIQKSYETYLEALNYNPADFHSLKGIAWIAFSRDKNTNEAKRIISFLKENHPIPDYDLLLSEIAAYENNSHKSEKHKMQFLAEASKPIYGNMYQRYIALENSTEKATLIIANAEIKERPHPMSYELLAWTFLQNGEKEKALEILENHVLEKTSEPDALFHAGIILKENGLNKEAKNYLKEALDASFELGPLAANEIRLQLESL